MHDPAALLTALLRRLRSEERGQGSLEWVVIAGGAVVLALAIVAVIYAVTVGWGHHIQSAPGQ